MVGRAESLGPAVEQRLADYLARAIEGDPAARKNANREFQKLGRFAEPAFYYALRKLKPEHSQAAWKVYNEAIKPVS
jgi:hypothetical protein